MNFWTFLDRNSELLIIVAFIFMMAVGVLCAEPDGCKVHVGVSSKPTPCDCQDAGTK